jgi:hypothetical protein
MRSPHCQPPWRLAEDGRSVITADGTVLTQGVVWPLADIVAAVNAVAGIPDDRLEWIGTREPEPAVRLRMLAMAASKAATAAWRR